MDKTRKPAGREERRRRLPLPAVRAQIWDAASELAIAGETRSIVNTLAKRFIVPALTIEAVLVLEGMRHQRMAAAFRAGIMSTLELAREATASLERDVSEVA